ncbi:phenylalanine ammonia-lyase [Xylariaceae sp. FL0804]|nr:phenylalanine ammonia-lyase [Xylariaceae sp. FL0804]
MDERPHPHIQRTRAIWKRMDQHRKRQEVLLDGQSLDVAGVVAVARYIASPLSYPVLQLGVNTGFGGSADVRTTDLAGLQVALMQHTQSGVLVRSDVSDGPADDDDQEELGRHAMPRAWVKASMTVRANANIRGHSAMRLCVAEAIAELVRRDCTPIVPLRGSISASGDLTPLSYIAGAVMGNPDVSVQVGGGRGGGARRVVMSARRALARLGLPPVTLGPKEGLSLINGTAPSAAAASLAVYDAGNLAVLCQLLTALAAEGLAANVEWAHPFIADIRPHPGQIEAACNIRSFLRGSRLVTGLGPRAKDRFRVGIAQERYALRSAPQWLSPVLEDLLAALGQVETELNSTSDNPVVNVARDDVHCGANFQAASVTLAAEKTRLCLQMLGKLVFAQTTELINNALNAGLPPNLAADDPSLSFCLKGVDTNVAAYMAELAFLAGPVSSHVQSAEMHNQSVNSLALVTSRYTLHAVEVLSLMVAAALYTACQAADLRVLHTTFLEDALRPALARLLRERLPALAADSPLPELVRRAVRRSWEATACLDASERAAEAARDAAGVLAEFLATSPEASACLGDGEGAAGGIRGLHALRHGIGELIHQTYLAHRSGFFQRQTTAQYLGEATRSCYEFVRTTLGVPFHQGITDQPGPSDAGSPDRPKKIIGSWVSIVYESVRDGRLIEHVLREADNVIEDSCV